MIINFNYKKKRYFIEAKPCNTLFSQFLGLMFKKNSANLVFIFKKKTNIPIHSLFCRKFIAVWFNDNEIIYIRKINSWKLNIKPKEKFNKILEIPINNKNYQILLEELRKV